jgi:hypothetical protein
VDHACGVDHAQALRQTRGQPHQRPDGQRPAFSHRVGQRRPGNIGRGQPRHRSIQIRIDHGRGEPAAHLPGDGDFPVETRPELRIHGQIGADDLHRHLLASRRKTEEYPAHAADAKLRAQPVRPDQLRITRL